METQYALVIEQAQDIYSQAQDVYILRATGPVTRELPVCGKIIEYLGFKRAILVTHWAFKGVKE